MDCKEPLVKNDTQVKIEDLLRQYQELRLPAATMLEESITECHFCVAKKVA
jgi:hypothetical protein